MDELKKDLLRWIDTEAPTDWEPKAKEILISILLGINLSEQVASQHNADWVAGYRDALKDTLVVAHDTLTMS